MAALLEALHRVLFSVGYAEVVGDRPLAVALYRAAQASNWEVSGGSFSDIDGVVIYFIKAEPPLCSGGCGGRPGSVTGMCYQCECEAHADGWYDQDTGYARI